MPPPPQIQCALDRLQPRPRADAGCRGCSQMLDYNVPGGKLNRGMAVLDVLRALKHPAVRHMEHHRLLKLPICSSTPDQCRRRTKDDSVCSAGAERPGGVHGQCIGLVHRVGASLVLMLSGTV